jgi:hypothetical protein
MDDRDQLTSCTQPPGHHAATNNLRDRDHSFDDALLRHLSPLGWEHINLTGDYTWRSTAKMGVGKLRPLRPLARP